MIVNAPVNFNHETQPEFELPIKNYQEFYRFYLTEHRNIMSRRLHAVGSSIGLYFFQKLFVRNRPNTHSMVWFLAMHVHGLDILCLRKINLRALNSHFIALFLIGECSLMLRLVD